MSKLIDVTQQKDILTSLLKLYNTNSCLESFGYYTLKTYIRWLELVPNLEHTKIYTYGDWQQSGLYLILDRYHLMLNSLKPNDSDLYNALKLIDWSYGHKIYPIQEEHYEAVLKALQELNIIHSEIKLTVYKLPREEAQNWQVTCPADYELTTLTSADADLVNSLWIGRQPGSIHFIRRCIDMNENVALRNRHNGKLVAWCIRDSRSLIGTLHVIDECQRQGLATFIICHFAQKIFALGEYVWATVRETNKPSRGCFEKMKFNHYGSVYILNTTTGPGEPMWTKD